jgi:hypothetical protein
MMICGHPQIPFTVHAIDGLPDAGYASRATQMFALSIYAPDGGKIDNITDWGLKQFKDRYKAASPQPSPASGGGSKSAKARTITKEAIFHYVYAVLHDPCLSRNLCAEPQA